MQSNGSDIVCNNQTFFQMFHGMIASVKSPLEVENKQLKEDLERTNAEISELKNEIKTLNANLLKSRQELSVRTKQLEQTATKLQAVEKEKAEQSTRVLALEAEICKLNQEQNACNTILLNLFDKLGSSFASNEIGDSVSEDRSLKKNLQTFAKLFGRGSTFKEREKDKALEASRQQVATMKLELEKVRKEKGELNLDWSKAQDKIVQMRKELAEQDQKLLEKQQKLNAMDFPSRLSTGNVERGASLVEEGADADSQSEHSGESIQNDGLPEPISQAVPGPSRLTATSNSSCYIPRLGVRILNEGRAVRIKAERNEVVLNHKKAPKSKVQAEILGQYSCVCRKTFGSHKSLETHQLNSKKKKFLCPYGRKDDEETMCAQIFSNRSDFKMHCEKEHGIESNAGTVCCSLCSQYFPRSELHKHKKAKHIVDLTSDDDAKTDKQCCSSSNKNKKRKKN